MTTTFDQETAWAPLPSRKALDESTLNIPEKEICRFIRSSIFMLLTLGQASARTAPVRYEIMHVMQRMGTSPGGAESGFPGSKKPLKIFCPRVNRSRGDNSTPSPDHRHVETCFLKSLGSSHS
jgi:hypothetical protein